MDTNNDISIAVPRQNVEKRWNPEEALTNSVLEKTTFVLHLRPAIYKRTPGLFMKSPLVINYTKRSKWVHVVFFKVARNGLDIPILCIIFQLQQ